MKQYASHSKLIRAVLLTGVAAGLLQAPIAAAAVVIPDTVTVATVNGAAGGIIDVPVSIRDASGTPLGLDQPPGSRIQSYAIKVTYSPASSVSAITFTRAGITSSLTPTFEISPTSPGAISLLDTFQESTNLIPFTLDGALPGNKVAHLSVALSPSAPVGSVVTLTIDPTLTQLTDEAGDPPTIESTSNGRLVLVNGAITVLPSVPAMSHIVITMLGLALALIGVRFIRFQ
jgi:hypothetical protein